VKIDLFSVLKRKKNLGKAFKSIFDFAIKRSKFNYIGTPFENYKLKVKFNNIVLNIIKL